MAILSGSSRPFTLAIALVAGTILWSGIILLVAVIWLVGDQLRRAQQHSPVI